MASQRVILGLALLLAVISMRMDVIRAAVVGEQIEEEESLEAELEQEAGTEIPPPSDDDRLRQLEAVTDIPAPSDDDRLRQLEAVTDIPAPSDDDRLRQQTLGNSNALKKLAQVMNSLVHETSNQRCVGSGTKTEDLTTAIREGFSILVGAVQDLNQTMRHFKEEIERKAFSEATESPFENDGPCPSPFFQAGDECLYIETEHLRYFDAARQACLDMGAKLAEFESFGPFITAVTDMDIHDDAEIYIGATDEENEGVWRWLSGGRLPDIRWGDGEPSNSYGREHCITFNRRYNQFNDIPCSFRREYACIKK